jgi:hypothetical protein
MVRRNSVELATGASKRLHQSLQSSGRAMDALACVYVLDLDYAAFLLADCVDSMDAKAATTNEPRNH